jgi:hypothetical protein
MKILIIHLIMMVILISCQRQETNTDHLPDEYVLVEFAASLEEDYEKIYPETEQKKPEPHQEVPPKNY